NVPAIETTQRIGFGVKDDVLSPGACRAECLWARDSLCLTLEKGTAIRLQLAFQVNLIAWWSRSRLWRRRGLRRSGSWRRSGFRIVGIRKSDFSVSRTGKEQRKRENDKALNHDRLPMSGICACRY